MTISTQQQTIGRPGLLRRFNVATVVNRLQTAGPLSRAELARETRVSFPTVAKICDALIRRAMVETHGEQQQGMGRPATSLRMASSRAQVVAVAAGPAHVRVALAGLDGQVLTQRQIARPSNYEDLIDEVSSLTRELRKSTRARTLGMGIAVPGLFDANEQRVLYSPNLPLLEGRMPGRDLRKRTGLPVAVVESMQAAFLAERVRGQAVELDDFAVVNYRGGMGLAVASGGRLVAGASGMAGELGHVVVEPGGIRCECGNRGCLETVATDIALAKAVSRRLRRSVSVEQLVAILQESPDRIEKEVNRALDFLAVGIGIVINLFNPQAVFLLGRFLEDRDELFARLLEQVPRSSVEQLVEGCTIARTRVDTLQGAALAIVDELVNQFVTSQKPSGN